MIKYKLTDEFIEFNMRKLYRIKALMDFSDVKKGDLGGYVEKEANLSHCGDAWVYGNARVYGNAWVYGDARVYGDAQVYGDARVCGKMTICSNNDFSLVSNFGSENRTTIFAFNNEKQLVVKCGCFYGTIERFREKVKETHKDSYLAKEYLMIADLMEMRFANRKEQKK